MSSRAERPSEDPGTKLVESGEAIARAVEQLGPAYLMASARRVVDAWGGLDGPARVELDEALAGTATAASQRVAHELRLLLALPALRQRSTPLELVRSLPVEPTAVLEAAGVPPVVRDAFDERTWPADRYDLGPRRLTDLGDPRLASLQIEWGLAKAAVLRSEHEPFED